MSKPRDDHAHDNPDLDRGLAFDVSTLITRRRALAVIAGGTLAAVAGCTATGAPGTPSATPSASGSVANATTEIPDETAGPFPGDGSNGPNVLDDSGIVRSDIRSSFGEFSGLAEGVPLTINLSLLNLDSDGAAYQGAAVYVWHCDANGAYSLYSEGATDQNYLRGVQVTDADGRVRFTSIFPAAYSGRWPHVHFEVYATEQDATSGGEPISTSQLALPQSACDAVYATEAYASSVSNMAETSLGDDNVFGEDDGVHQLAKVSGSVDAGYVASLTVPIAASTAATRTNAGEGGRPRGRDGQPQ